MYESVILSGGYLDKPWKKYVGNCDVTALRYTYANKTTRNIITLCYHYDQLYTSYIAVRQIETQIRFKISN